MQPLLHSPFLQALGYSIINSLWQFAFLWLSYFAINTLFKLSSHQKYSVGLVLQITGFIWFIITLVVYYNQSVLIPYPQDTQEVSSIWAIYPNATIKQRFFLLVLRCEQFFPYLSIAYLALVFILAIRWIYAYNFTQKVRFTGVKEIDDAWRLFVYNISLQLGIERQVGIYLSELVQTPLTIGFFKPIILIPLATINYLDSAQMEAVIVHELAHIKRYDYLFNLLLAFIEACLFFNPFMQLIDHQVKKERENCCDDWVLKYKYSASSYARALLKIATNQTQKPLLALNATDNKKLLITRIKRIIEKNENNFFNHTHQLFALLVLTTVFSSLSLLSAKKKVAAPSGELAKTARAIEPTAANVRNPLFNPVFFLADTAKPVVTEKAAVEAKLVKTKTAASSVLKPSSSYPRFTPNDLAVAPVDAEDENDKTVEIHEPASRSAHVVPFSVFSSLNSNTNAAKREVEKEHSTELEIENWFPKEGYRQFEIAQNQIKTVQKEALKEYETTPTIKKLKGQLNNLLDQLKSSKKQVELTKLQSVVRIHIKKSISEMKKGDGGALLPDINVFKLNELELLQHEIERAINSIEEPSFTQAGLNSSVSYNIQIPAVAYYTAKEKVHHYSFEYSSTPPVHISKWQAKTNASNSPQKENLSDGDDEGDNITSYAPPAPPARATRLRAVYIIHI